MPSDFELSAKGVTDSIQLKRLQRTAGLQAFFAGRTGRIMDVFPPAITRRILGCRGQVNNRAIGRFEK